VAKIWEGKWVKDTDSEVFVFLGTCFNFGSVILAKRPPKSGLFHMLFQFCVSSTGAKERKKSNKNFYSTYKRDQNAPCFMENG
jgi:hypothetical protein